MVTSCEMLKMYNYDLLCNAQENPVSGNFQRAFCILSQGNTDGTFCVNICES